MPVPQRFLDIMRTTETDLSDHSEATIRDYWTGTERQELAEFWKGRTIFFIRRPKPPSGYTCVNGKLVKIQTTTRPGNILPELWFTMTKKAQKAGIEEWKIEGPRRIAERAKHGIPEFIPEADVDEFWKSIEEARAKYEVPYAPAMPVIGNTFLFHSSIKEEDGDEPESEDERPSLTREHQDHFACPGTVSPEYFALIHTPLSIGDAMRIPDAKKALMAEWDKLKSKKAWLPETVCEREAVIWESQKGE